MILITIQSSIILFLALCAVALMRRQSSATRHAVLTAGLISSIALPIAGGFLPTFQFPLSPAFSVRVQDQTETFGTLDSEVKRTPATVPGPVAASNHFFRRIWLSGISIAGIVLIAGAARIAWLTSRARPLTSAPWTAAAGEISRVLRIRRTVRLLQNSRAVLGTWGVLRPRIFLPQSAEGWSDERMRVVLTHEVAHIQRLDWLVQIMAEMARGLYWFNPLFWLVCRWLRIESEQACDDVVLNAGFDPKNYAAHLLELARSLKSSDRAWSPIMAMSRPPNLEKRFVAMLNPSVNRRSTSFTGVFVICVMFICVTSPVAAMRLQERSLQNASLTAAPVAGTSASTKIAPPVVTPVVSKAVASKAAVPKPQLVQGAGDGSLSGTVSDGTGAVVPGVRLTAVSVDQRTVEEAVTGEAGRYEFKALAAGLYLLTAKLPGFLDASRRAEIKSRETSHQNIVLSVGGVAQRVEVNAVGQPKPARQPGTPQRIRVGGYIQAANLISQVKPIYPQSARDAGIEGTVILQGTIGIDGTLGGLRVLSSNDPDLSAAAIESVRQWRYRPTLLNNEPIEVITEIDVEFKLSQ